MLLCQRKKLFGFKPYPGIALTSGYCKKKNKNRENILSFIQKRDYSTKKKINEKKKKNENKKKSTYLLIKKYF